jgi:hypothetical protein
MRNWDRDGIFDGEPGFGHRFGGCRMHGCQRLREGTGPGRIGDGHIAERCTRQGIDQGDRRRRGGLEVLGIHLGDGAQMRPGEVRVRVHGIVDATRLGSGSDVRGAIELGLGRRDKLLPVIAEKYSDSGVEGRQGCPFGRCEAVEHRRRDRSQLERLGIHLPQSTVCLALRHGTRRRACLEAASLGPACVRGLSYRGRHEAIASRAADQSRPSWNRS